MAYVPESSTAAETPAHLRACLGDLLCTGNDRQAQLVQTALCCCAAVDSREGPLSCLESAELQGVHDVESFAPFDRAPSGMPLTLDSLRSFLSV